MNEDKNQMANGRLVIVSNRLPIVISKDDGVITTLPGSGGLVTALAPVLKNRGGVWIGWPGIVELEDQNKIDSLLKKQNIKVGYHLRPIYLTNEEIKLYYDGFSNEIIWPLFHDLQSQCNFSPAYWSAYQDVNHKFAEAISQIIKSKDFIWIHDYHLMLVGQELRQLGVKQKVGFFLHIPFPPLDIFIKLPWRFQVLHALLEYDLIGFQTLRDQRNFIQCVKRLLPKIKKINLRQFTIFQTSARDVRVGAFPISINFNEFCKMAEEKAVINQSTLYHQQFKGQKIVFSCDRLDISKGIPYRLEAIRYLLDKYPQLHEKVTFFQVVIPSRIDILKYQNLKKEIDRLVGEINSQFTKTGWVPIHYVFQHINRTELIVYYRISDIALITPVKDGMNLVAKEYIASNANENGVLILSEFAGAATQLQREALLINPYDIQGVAETIYKALSFSISEKRKRMRRMRRNVQHNDVFQWVRCFLKAAISKELTDFPIIEEYTPTNDDINSTL